MTSALPDDSPDGTPRAGISDRRIVGTLGCGLLLVALVCNEWVLAYFLSPDGVIDNLNRALIWTFDLVVGATGLLLIRFRRRIRVLALLASAMAVVVGLVVIEVFLRMTDLGPPRLATQNPHGTGSFRLKPNLDFAYPYGAKQVRIRTNSHGMRWREVALTKLAGKKRIAFVGDSFTFGESADSIEESCVGVFDAHIDRTKYQVLNFGVVGYGFADIRLQLEEDILAFSPDYVILVSFNGNDFRDTYLGLDQYDVSSGTVRWNNTLLDAKIPAQYRPVTKDGERSPEPSVVMGLRLLRVINGALARLREHGVAQAHRDLLNQQECVPIDFVGSTEFTSFTFWSASRRPDIAVRATDAGLRELTRIHALCQEHHIPLLIVALPFEEQVYARVPVGQDPNGVAYDIALPQAHVKIWAETNTVPYLDLLPLLREHALRQGECLYARGLDMHLNTVGHAIVGRAIVDFFHGVHGDG